MSEIEKLINTRMKFAKMEPKTKVTCRTTIAMHLAVKNDCTSNKVSCVTFSKSRKSRRKINIQNYDHKNSFYFQITQLKIASNPFAKGFRDCDPEEW